MANTESVTARLFGIYWYHLDAPRHLYLFTPNNLSDLLVKEGFVDQRVMFCSAGGIVGSLQYLFRMELLSRAWLIMLIYPIEWMLDKLRSGDIFVIRARKGSL